MIIIADTICNSFHMFGFGKKILKSSRKALWWIFYIQILNTWKIMKIS